MAKVLIADDEADLLQNLASFLSSFPGEFDIATAQDGADAIAAIEDDSGFDILLTDVRMPKVDGIELVRRALKLRPDLAVVVMTAFGSEDLRQMATRNGALRYLEKPLDLDHLRSVLLEIALDDSRVTREVGGLDVCEVTQFIALSGESKVIRLRAAERAGVLVFETGELVHCSANRLRGFEAFAEMVLWGEATFSELRNVRRSKYRRNINQPVKQVLEEALRFRAEVTPRDSGRTHDQPTAGAVTTHDDRIDVGEEKVLMAVKEFLEEFQGIEGFKGAAVFTAQGEMLEQYTTGKIDIKTVGMFANNALLNAQKATDQMGVGRGNFMQIRAPQATVLMRCLNEATDFAATKEGKAHFHTVVIMDPEGNTGMASMVLDKIVTRVADELR